MITNYNLLIKEKIRVVTSSKSRFEGLNNRTHGLVNGGHLSLSIKPSDNGIEPGGEPQVIHLFSPLTNGVLSIDPSTVHVSFLDRLLHFQFLRFLFLLALPWLPLQRFRCEFQVHDLIQQLLCVSHFFFSLYQYQIIHFNSIGFYQLSSFSSPVRERKVRGVFLNDHITLGIPRAWPCQSLPLFAICLPSGMHFPETIFFCLTIAPFHFSISMCIHALYILIKFS